MAAMILISFSVFAVVGFGHFAILSRIAPPIMKSEMSHNMQHLVLVVAIGILHALEAMVYAVTFMVGQDWGLGGFKPDAPQSLMDIYYFSLVNYTTLGLGDIYPSGHLRFLAGLESLGGFLLLSCSASYLFTLSKSHLKTD